MRYRDAKPEIGSRGFADFDLMLPNWGAHFRLWVASMSIAYPWLEIVYLKRMSMTDDDLTLISHSFPSFKELVLLCCDGFDTSGLAVITSKCRYVHSLSLSLLVEIWDWKKYG